VEGKGVLREETARLNHLFRPPCTKIDLGRGESHWMGCSCWMERPGINLFGLKNRAYDAGAGDEDLCSLQGKEKAGFLLILC